MHEERLFERIGLFERNLFRNELHILKELAPEFARLNPALAPLLEGEMSDPDVERLLEAIAFLNAMLRQKLAHQLPRMIQMLARLVIPQFSRPIPATTILCFTSHATDGQSVTIPAGARFASVPVDGKKCIFTTTADLEIHPLELTSAIFAQHARGSGEIRLSLSLKGISLSRWQPTTALRFCLTGDFASASGLFLFLCQHLSGILLTPADGGAPVTLPPDRLKPAWFSEDQEPLFYPANAFPGYQWLREYFNTPGKLLSFDLDLRERVPRLGDGMEFSISFVLDNLPSGPPLINSESFSLNAVMAVNLFPHDADPISVNHRVDAYLIRPGGPDSAHHQVYSVDRVTGYARATAGEREYLPFDMFDNDSAEPVYHARPSGRDVYLEVAYPGEMPPPDTETLSIALTCTNGNLPANLHIGDISEPLTLPPEFITVRNVTSVTPGQPPRMDSSLLQELISHLRMNHLPLESVEHLTTLLKLYAFSSGFGTGATANLKRIAGIVGLDVAADERMVEGIPMRGRDIRIKVRQDHFAGVGDMYLFGCMLDRFLCGYASTNTHIRLTLNESTRGVTYRWPARLGNCVRPGLEIEPRQADSGSKTGRGFSSRIRQTGPNSRSPIDDLVAHGHRYSYHQVMRIAQRTFSPGGKEHIPGMPWQKRVHIRPDLTLAFPPSDVLRVERHGTELLITTTFLALHGSSSPLPTFYTEELMEEAANDSSVSRDFVDIFHQRIYTLFFECAGKYSLFNRIGEEKQVVDLERLYCLIGMGEKELRDSVPEAWSMLRYTGLFSQFPRSALGLQTLLRDALEINCLMVEQCVPRRVAIPTDQRMRLGLFGISLGVNTVLGREVHDRAGKIRIRIGPLKKELFNRFLPGARFYYKLARLIGLYITDPLESDLKLILSAGEARPIRLGDPNGARLGLGTWCFSGETTGEVNTAFSIVRQVARADDSENHFDHPDEITEPYSLIELYRRELARQGEQVSRYVKKHPEMVPLVSGHMADAGVERTLEGAAFLNAHFRMKLHDDFPEVIHELTEALHPWNLRPKPAMTIVAFIPKAELKQSVPIPAGVEVASIPVQGTICGFKTCFDVTVHPLTLLNASFRQPSGQMPCIKLCFELNGIDLSLWKTNSLRFFLGDDYPEACNLYLLLTSYLKRITITSLHGTVDIPCTCLKPVGLADDETTLTQEKSFMPGHPMLQEYFLFHDKFLFMDLTGLDKCNRLGNGSRFDIDLELTACPPVIPRINEKSFVLSATPVVNLFSHKAKSVSFTSDLRQHLIQPADDNCDHYQLYSVERVSGSVRNRSEKIEYALQNRLFPCSRDGYTCHVTRSKSFLGDGFDTFLSIPMHTDKTQTGRIKLDIDLTCSNGILAEQLKIGDICSATPDFVELRNIKEVTAASFQGIGQNRQWKLLSAFSLNSLSLDGADNFRAILRLFIDSSSRNQIALIANTKKIDAIEFINAKPGDRLMGRDMYRGYDICLKLRGSHFEGPGDLYLFCSVLERFLGGYVTRNCFIRLTVEEIGKGYRFEWPTRFGDRCVL